MYKESCDLVPHKVCTDKVRQIPRVGRERRCQTVGREVCGKERTVQLKEKTLTKSWCEKRNATKNSSVSSFTRYFVFCHQCRMYHHYRVIQKNVFFFLQYYFWIRFGKCQTQQVSETESVRITRISALKLELSDNVLLKLAGFTKKKGIHF